MAEPIILCSGSSAVKKVLQGCGLAVETLASNLDNNALEAPLERSGASAEDVALVLAEGKATEMSARHPGSLVLGCEQTLSLDDEILHAPTNMEGARRRLLLLSGKTHNLHSAAVLARDGFVLWRNVGVATLTMRDLDPGFVGRHLARVGDKALLSAGCYEIDGEGIQLFAQVEGDYFTMVGVPLLPLLDELRRLKAIDG